MTTERIGPLMVWHEAGAVWRYLPMAPSPQRNEDGHANVTVMDVGGMVILTIGARLQAEEADLAAARTALAAKGPVDLRPASATVTGASLRLVAADKTEVELATARPSNLPPYSAAFSAMLQGDQAKAVKEALPAGRVIVRYVLDLPRTLAATAELAGPWDGTGAVDAALARGDLQLRTVRDEGSSDALVTRATAKAKAEATTRLMTSGGGCSPTATRSGTFVEVTETEEIQDSLTLEAGIAGWMK